MRIRGFWLLAALGLITIACSSNQVADSPVETDSVLEPADAVSQEPGDGRVVFTAADIEALQMAVTSAEEDLEVAEETVRDAEDIAREASRESASFRQGMVERSATASDTLQAASAAARIATDQQTSSARADASNAAQLAAQASDELNQWREDLLAANDAELVASLTENAAVRQFIEAEFALEMAEYALDQAEDSETRARDPLVAPADWPTWMAQPESPITMVTVDVPRVPVVALPDLSPPTELSTQIEADLGEILTPSSGIEVATARCVATGGPLRYEVAEDATDLLDTARRGSSISRIIGGGRNFVVAVDSDDSGSFVDFTGDTFVQTSRNADGSGAYQDFTDDRFFRLYADGDGFGTLIDRSGDTDYALSLNPDGSGWLEDLGGSTFVVVLVRSDGSATYRDLTDSLSFNLSVNADGSWFFHDLSDGRNEELIVNADGTGVYENLPGDGSTTIAIGNDGAARYRERSGERDIEVALFPDGSWRFEDRSDEWDRTLSVAGDGSGWFEDDGEPGRLSAADTAPLTALVEPLLNAAQDGSLLHPGLLTATPIPEFAIADRFPPIGSLPQLAPTCATVVRFGPSVLFDADSDVLRGAAEPILDDVAAALRRNDQAIEVHGHADAIGTDEANLELSQRRAEALVEALTERGVDTEIVATGFGASQPIAANEQADGSDDPAGRLVNSRIEIVLFQ